MRNVKFDGIQEDLTAPNTPWIYYGASPGFRHCAAENFLLTSHFRDRMPVHAQHT